jgi:GNAT superfamily N-acetyltransferase
LPSSFTIRPALREDCPRLLELIRELALYEKAPNEVTVSDVHFAESGFGDKPVWWAFVAEDTNGIQGFALYYIRYSTWKGQCLYLEDIIVTAAMRGKGIGSALFETILREAKEKRMARVCWQVLDWNEPAIQFYKKYQASLDPEWINGAIEISLDR